MKILSVRLDDTIYEEVYKLAVSERRSVNAQINILLQRATKDGDAATKDGGTA